MNIKDLRNRYVVMRHGQSVANARTLIASSPALALDDFGLTTVGVEQVQRTIKARGDEMGRVSKLFTSDFCRAQQTAEIASELLGVPVEQATSLRERFFGDFDGQSDTNYATVWSADRDDASHQLWGVESVQSVAERMVKFVRKIDSQATGETYLLVSHGDPLQILLTASGCGDIRLHRQFEPLQTAELRSLN